MARLQNHMYDEVSGVMFFFFFNERVFYLKKKSLHSCNNIFLALERLVGGIYMLECNDSRLANKD